MIICSNRQNDLSLYLDSGRKPDVSVVYTGSHVKSGQMLYFFNLIFIDNFAYFSSLFFKIVLPHGLPFIFGGDGGNFIKITHKNITYIERDLLLFTKKHI